MKVHEIMTAPARCVGPDNTLVEAAGLMRQLDIGAVPVCENDRLTGMLTDRDIAVRAVADGRDPNSTLVSDVMSPGIVSVRADQQVEEAVRLMQDKQIRRLPVVNREQRLVGIVALGDIAVSSQPAFSGMTLREVSESAQTLSRGRSNGAARGSRTAMALPNVPGVARRAPAVDGAEPKTRKRKSAAKRARVRTTGRKKSAASARGRKR